MKIILKIVSLRVFSRIYGWFTRRRRPRFLVKRVIRFFQNMYGIEMDGYKGEPEDYKSLAEFFVRPLDPAVRPLEPQKDILQSPADGVFSSLQTITEDVATQVKGKTYSVSEFVGESLDFTEGWHVAVIYLSPYNYHRYHYPLDGTVKRCLHTGVRLFPVNHMGLNNIKQLFVRNERFVLEMETNGVTWYISPVGATFVGSMDMTCLDNVDNGKIKPKRHQWHTVDQKINKLDEMGRFNLGSTIVMVMPKSMATPMEENLGKPVKVGEPLFKIKKV